VTKKLVFLVEEPSMQEALRGILPRIVGNEVPWQVVPHEGKRDLEGSVPRKLRGWREPGVQFVVVCDQHAEVCQDTKLRLSQLCKEAGRPDTLVRIVCRELESWFLGDLSAVEQSLGLRNIASQQDNAKFRRPDQLGNAAEEIRKLAGHYSKRAGARAIGPNLSLNGNRSHSFNVFVAGVRRLVHGQAG
jgi:hypothetical protein